MKSIRVILCLFVCAVFVSCSSVYSEKVVHRMDGLSERPEWATMTRSMFKKEGYIYVVGLSSGEEGSRISALARISDNNARHELSKFITSEVGFVFQNLEEAVDEEQIANYYSSEISKTVLRGMITEKKYYEKIQVNSPREGTSIRVDVYTLIKIKEKHLKRLVRKASKRNDKTSEEVEALISQKLISSIEAL